MKKRKWLPILAVLALIGVLAFGGTSAVMALSSTENTGGFSLAGLLSSYRMFYGAGELTGGNGTAYSGNITDADGALVDSSTSAGYLTAEEEQPDYDVKYAVSIYGINHDTYLDDNGKSQTAGLTFGPATGANYTASYEAHLTESEFLSGNSGVCLHWMTWEEIIIQSEVDPTAFQECLENGCTHSVEVVLSDAILDTSYAGQMDNGDGSGVFRYCIKQTYRKWILSGSGEDFLIPWSQTRMRSTLNGTDGYTNSTYAGTDTLSTSECIFSGFPEVLQEAIVAKEVKTNAVHASTKKSDVETTYDKLWLFSYRELAGYNGTANLQYEGNQYEKMSALNVGSAIKLDPATAASKVLLVAALENGNLNGMWWLRSSYTGSSSYNAIYVVLYTGVIGVYSTSATAYNIAPGFCLP